MDFFCNGLVTGHYDIIRSVLWLFGVTFSTNTLMTAIILLVAGLMYWAVSELR